MVSARKEQSNYLKNERPRLISRSIRVGIAESDDENKVGEKAVAEADSVQASAEETKASAKTSGKAGGKAGGGSKSGKSGKKSDASSKNDEPKPSGGQGAGAGKDSGVADNDHSKDSKEEEQEQEQAQEQEQERKRAEEEARAFEERLSQLLGSNSPAVPMIVATEVDVRNAALEKLESVQSEFDKGQSQVGTTYMCIGRIFRVGGRSESWRSRYV